MTNYGKITLTLPDGHREQFSLDKSSVILGRALTSDVVVRDALTSREHFRIDFDSAGNCTITDLDSANGTMVNGQKIKAVSIQHGDVIRLGKTTVHFVPHVPVSDGSSDHTIIENMADLDATMHAAPPSMLLNDHSTPHLVVQFRDEIWEVPIIGAEVRIGRKLDIAVSIPDDQISREHAVIERKLDRYILRDLGSRNGVWLGANRLDNYVLMDGDTLRVGDALIIFRRGFSSEDVAQTSTGFLKMKKTRPPVVVIPGLMGSELWQGSERVWPRVRQLFSNPGVYALKDGEPINPMDPRGLVGEVVLVPGLIELQQYSRLGDYLEEELGYERGNDLLEFPYDWRQDCRKAARELGATIDAWKPNQQVVIIGHSLGALVSRYYIERLGGHRRVSRQILLGSPNNGTPWAITSLIPETDFVPFGFLGRKMGRILVTLPSMYQMLPNYPTVYDQNGQVVDIMSDDRWVLEEHRPLLKDAKKFYREIGTTVSVPTVSIFGYGIKTITKIVVERDKNLDWTGLRTERTEQGDGTIHPSSAIVPNTEIHPVKQQHGALYVDADVQMRLMLELMQK